MNRTMRYRNQQRARFENIFIYLGYTLLQVNNCYFNALQRRRWAGNLAPMEGVQIAYTTLAGKPEEKTPLAELGVDRGIILKWILN
jgi:hypothetical protein